MSEVSMAVAVSKVAAATGDAKRIYRMSSKS